MYIDEWPPRKCWAPKLWRSDLHVKPLMNLVLAPAQTPRAKGGATDGINENSRMAKIYYYFFVTLHVVQLCTTHRT